MSFLGIDPGNSGCLVVMGKGGEYISHLQAPIVLHGKKKRLNGVEVADFIRLHEIEHAFVEQVGAMPGQGVTSMFTFGYAAGIVEGILTAEKVSHTFVTPQKWKRSQGFSGKDKDATRGRAIQLYPQIRDLSLKGKGQALADAIFICRHGLKIVE